MFGKFNYITVRKYNDHLTEIEVYDKYPKWKPNYYDLLSNVSITVDGPGISIKGRKEVVEEGLIYYDYVPEIEKPDEYEEGDCEKKEITEWKWFKKTTREAYFPTKNWITKKFRPTIEINTSVYRIIDNRQNKVMSRNNV